jgi:hypothetical protein
MYGISCGICCLLSFICTESRSRVVSQIFLLLIILQENTGTGSVEIYVDLATGEGPTDIKTKAMYMPSAFCVNKAEPEVSLYDGVLGSWYMGWPSGCRIFCAIKMLQDLQQAVILLWSKVVPFAVLNS